MELSDLALAQTTLAFVSHFFDGRGLPSLATGAVSKPDNGVDASPWDTAHIDWPNASCNGHQGIYAVVLWLHTGLAGPFAWFGEVKCRHLLSEYMSALQIGLEGIVSDPRQPSKSGQFAGPKKRRARLPLQCDPYLPEWGETSRGKADFDAVCWNLPRFGM